MIRRTEVVAIALVGLLIVCIIAGLYLAKAFFLPITAMAFIVGTMLSPVTNSLERCRIPRAVAAGAGRDGRRRRGGLHGGPDRLARG